jgi:hypothetical protein
LNGKGCRKYTGDEPTMPRKGTEQIGNARKLLKIEIWCAYFGLNNQTELQNKNWEI